MKTKQAISEVKEIKAQREATKAKDLLDETLGRYEDSDDEEEQIPRQRHKTIGLKRALARERQKEAELAEKLTPSELLAIDIDGDRESWLERENFNLEGQLEKVKRDTDI